MDDSSNDDDSSRWSSRMQKRLAVTETRLAELVRERHRQEELRNRHPALQDAWEKYQTLLILMGQFNGK